MAKITARGAHEVARVTTAQGPRFLLRSDGKVLRKLLPEDGWSITSTVKAGVPVTADTLRRIVERRGYVVR